MDCHEGEVIAVTFASPLDLTIHRPEGMYDPAAEHDACGVGMVTDCHEGEVIAVTFASPLDLTIHRPEGMYDPAAEHDACGVGMVTTLNTRPERKIVDDAIEVLINLNHRGAVGAEENTGDGAGILMSMPDEFMRAVIDAPLPDPKHYAAGIAFLDRGAVGAEENTGDGAGILMSMPDEFMRAVIDAPLPDPKHYAAGIAFLDRDIATSGQQERAIAKIATEEGLEVLAWRVVPTNPDGLGLQALASMPSFKMLVLADPQSALAGVDLDRKVYRVRKRAEHEVGVYFASLSSMTITYKGMLTTMQLKPFFPDLFDERMKATVRKRAEHEVGVYFASLSSMTITYKGMLTTMQLKPFFPDLFDERMKATIAIVHSRFSTNTFPSWPLAQPFRLIAHNGEINTIQGNRNWFSAREGRLSSKLLGDMKELLPILTPGYSDSGTFDEVLELLHLAGRSLPHAILMMVPPAWENNKELLLPILTPGYSDSGTFDEVLELLHLAGRSLPHAILMMVPPAWENNKELDPDVRAFYEYNNTLIEPWDGPADIVFTDGELVGALLDRNGFRPGRWWDGPADIVFTDGELVGALLDRNGFRPGRWQITDDGYVVLASESGVLPQVGEEHIVRKGRLEPGKMFLIDTARGEVIEDDVIKHELATAHPYREWQVGEEHIVRKGRLEPGKMFLIDTARGEVIEDDVIKHELATAHPYREWVEDNTVEMKELPQRQHINYSGRSVHRRQRAFGYTQEELKMVLTPMANTGKEPLGSMGNDIPLSVLSSRSRMLFDYFMQKFAQVTNPPRDWEREKIVTSIASAIGPEPNLLEDCALHAKKVIIPQPVLTSDEMAQLKRLDRASQLGGYYKPYVIRGLYQVTGGGNALETRLEEIFAEIDQAIADGSNFLVLSDRDSNHMMAPIPSLLLTSAVQHHLLRKHTRTQISMVVEAGDVREIHHVALLIAYGAAAVNPYLAFESVEELSRTGYVTVDPETAIENLRNALSTGVLKIMSKMGVSTIMSYRGAQLFEAVGLDSAVIDKYAM